jgi:5,10-methylenetetrahydromethanopterin reductase
MEVWLHGFSIPGKVTGLARCAEDWGFAGLLLADSQNLTGDAWMELALAGAATSRLRLGTGVTNPITRHLAVTASAAATLQAETGGRAVVGFAQGDSALSQIGRRRLRVAEFEQAVQTLQSLLRAEAVDFDGTRSSIRWLASSELGKVPVHVAATGARTIAAGARHADGVDLTVGADPERLQWGAATAREAVPAGGSLSVGAYVNVAVVSGRHQTRDQARDQARELVRGRRRATTSPTGTASPTPPWPRSSMPASSTGSRFADRPSWCATVWARSPPAGSIG